MRKGIQNLYTELILTTVVLAFGTILLSTVKNFRPLSSSIEKTDSIAAYVINGSNKIIIANWGDEKKEVDLVCITDDESITAEPVIIEPNSTIAEEILCQGDLIVTLDGGPVPTFVITP